MCPLWVSKKNRRKHYELCVQGQSRCDGNLVALLKIATSDRARPGDFGPVFEALLQSINHTSAEHQSHLI
jgi:hypothetical protein